MWLMPLLAISQTDYYMSNATIYDCKGNFFDSENGQTTGYYDHNENLIFRICVPNAKTITISFSQLCIESPDDYLIIFDGPDTSSTNISGKLNGSTNPGSFQSSDSCLTFYFHSDGSVAWCGWEASWSTQVKPLLPPRFVSPPTPSCEATSVGIKLDQLFDCDSITAANFGITGTINPSITGVTPINCTNGQTDSFLITFSPALDRSGTYQIDFDAIKYDECDSAWQLHTDTTFSITDCPIYVNLIADPDTVCNGTCTEIKAEVTGGDSANYAFAWTPNISGTFGPNTYCPTSSGWVILTVSDGNAVPGSDSIWIEVVNPPVAMADTTVCQSNPPFSLSASPSGGIWRGAGIVDSINGVYDPQQPTTLRDTVTYWFAGCSDDVVVTIRAMDAGPPEGACPGSSAFYLTGFTPAGGSWSGTNVQSDGLFNPSDTGMYMLTYSWNGCSDDKVVSVYPIDVPPVDTVCQSTPTVQIPFTPAGGTWSGPGFLDYTDGLFYPPRAGGGNKRLIYSVHGCRDTMMMTVISINARGNQIFCPDAPPSNVYLGLPVGGYWTGVGITDSIAGTYDPSFVYDLGRTWYNDTLTYNVNGCIATKMAYVRQTVVGYDTLKYCIEDDSVLLDFNSTRRSPGGGVWSGAGVLGNYFNPSRAGYGTHQLIYDAYGCSDSIIMVVFDSVDIQQDTLLCVADSAIFLRNDPAGGLWSGPGTHPITGRFDPALAGVGFHTIYHQSVNGCLDSLEIEVEAKPVVNITRYDPTYCFKDSLFLIQGSPMGGRWFGPAITDSFFNPHEAGTGMHQLNYRFGTPTCYSEDSVVVIIRDTLFGALTISDDSLCDGEQAVLTATALRGIGGNYTYTWSTDPTGSRTIFQQPAASRWVHMTYSDGCSDDYRDSVFINVFPKIEVNALSSDIQCYGTTGWAEVTPRFADPYEVTWFTTPLRYTDRIVVPVANRYRFRVRNTLTNCFLDSSVYVLSYPRLKAHFITTPSPGHCLNPFDPTLFVINFTEGATAGTWDFGDGTTEAYDPAVNPSHVYRNDTNWYAISLRVENEGGCLDSFFSYVCLDDSVYLQIPNAFTPYGDDVNDFFHIRTAGVDEFSIQIFNRWGERVYESFDKDFSWDGNYLDKPLTSGVYVFRIEYKGKNTVRKSAEGVLHLLR